MWQEIFGRYKGQVQLCNFAKGQDLLCDFLMEHMKIWVSFYLFPI